MDQLLLLIRAGYPVIYLVSHEEGRVLDCMARLCRVIRQEQPRKRLFRWCQGPGLTAIDGLEPAAPPSGPAGWLKIPGLPEPVREQPHGNASAVEALNSVRTATQVSFADLSDAVIVFFDIHPYLNAGQAPGAGGELVRPLRNAADALRRYYDDRRKAGETASKTIVIVSPSDVGLSPELERDLIRVPFPLPERDELQRALQTKIENRLLAFPDPIPQAEIEASSQGGQALTPDEYKAQLCELVAGAGRGLTLEDYKLGLNMIAARRQPLCTRHIEDMLGLKAKAISNRALSYTPHVTIDLGGLEEVKEWTRIRRGAAVSEEVRRKYLLPPPRGVMLCGVSGGGKSQLAKLISKEFNLALLRLDIGSLFGSYVGESEQRTREALEMAEVLAPVVLWIDEIDKAFKGMGAGGDNGVSARVFGYFLTWLSEKQDSVFVVTTANDFQDLLNRFPEFGRKGRFDQIFWVTLPSAATRAEIFTIYLREPFDKGLLAVDDTSVDAVRSAYTIGQVKGNDPFERLCHVLGDTQLSANLTGAEIEYTVAVAKYRIYSMSVASSAVHRLTPSLLAEVVADAKKRALYRAGTADHAAFEALERAAVDNNGWPKVG
jgi:SpoVK/Ycf46/Vps4 family AAA+-type ATPase